MRAAFAVVACVLASAPASAQPKAPASDVVASEATIDENKVVLEIDDCPPAPPMAPDKLRQMASEHFERGDVLYLQGDYKGAVSELVSSYCLIPYYTILKSIGQAYERELNYHKALGYFSRYAMDVPPDAQRLSACDPDPQIDKKNVLARIDVLKRLKAKVVVDTNAPAASIVLANSNGVQARAKSGQQMEVPGGRYTLTIEAANYATYVDDKFFVDVGKPYTLFQELQPITVPLRVRIVPGDARIFLSQGNGEERRLGTGYAQEDIRGGTYQLVVESSGYVTVRKEIELRPGHPEDLSIELEPEPQVGRRQLIGYSIAAGGVAGGLLGAAADNGTIVTAGVFAGAAAGFFGTYWGTSRRVALGTSSLTITSSLIGAATAGSIALIVVPDEPRFGAPMIGSGLLLGGAAGYVLGEKFRIRPGDAALINTGALWGTTAGSLFATAFKANNKIGGVLVLSGLGMGTVGGVLITRYFTISRGHAALIDVGGVVGIFVGVAAESIFTQATSTQTSNTERTSNFALGGMAAGLIVAGVLTRNMDEPKLAISPTVGKTTDAGGKTTTTFGIGGSF